MKSATPTTEMGGYITTSPSLSTTALLRIQAYTALLLRTVMICLFAGKRIQWTYEDKNQSVYDNDSVVKIFGIVALYAVAVMAGIFWCVGMGLHRYYTVLKFVGSFSALLAPFSLMMGLLLPPKLNRIAYLIVCVMFAILVACFYLDDQQEVERSSTFDYLANCLVLVLIVLAVCFTKNLNWIACPLIYLALGMDSAYHLVT